MSPRRKRPGLKTNRWPVIAWAVMVLALTTGSAVAAPAKNMNVFEPVSPPAYSINGLFILTLAICGGILLLVGGAMLWFSIRYRRRAGDTNDEPPQLYGSHRIEIAWTLGPLLIVFVLFLVVFRVVAGIQGKTPPKHGDPIYVTVIAHQWWWEFKYPKLGITTANELHVPVSPHGKKYPVFLRLESADVIHDFWVPRLSGKQDVVPGHPNHLWFAPEKAGTYYGQCAEFCGAQHANMSIRVVAQSKKNFDKWVADHQKPAAAPATLTGKAKVGYAQFVKNSCISCHEVNGATPALGGGPMKLYFGPDLTHLMTRKTIGSGMIANTPKNLAAWITNPQTIKPGCHMPDMNLSKKQVSDIVAYLETLK